MYYYLKVRMGYPIRIIGLDLKQDVIDHCNQLSRKYGYDTLNFYHGDIAGYEGVSQVDMVVTLHACDTATDYALAKAVRQCPRYSLHLAQKMRRHSNGKWFLLLLHPASARPLKELRRSR